MRHWLVISLIFAASVSIGATGKSEGEHWAWKPVRSVQAPAVEHAGWVRNPVDAFVLAKLEEMGLEPSGEADRRTLIRRLSFDLLGLPPTPQEVDAFVSDAAPNAYEKLVDRLLASPHYGERWARHWLDVVHFGETHGYDKDKPRPHAWPYRDYVIRAFNEDKPYSRFVLEQLAGDVLFPGDPHAVVATGFIAAGPWDFVGHVELREGTVDKQLTRSNDRDDMVMTAMSTFQSLTVHCARCHNHKFDPISQEDYYRLQADFAGIDRGERAIPDDAATIARVQRLNTQREQIRQKLASITAELEKAAAPRLREIDDRMKALRDASSQASGSPSNGYHSAIEAKPDAVKWVQVDLGSSRPIEEVRLEPARPTDFPDTPGFGFPVRFKVEASDEASFGSSNVLEDHTGTDFANPGDTPVIIRPTNARGRYVRVTANRLWPRTNDYVFALAELEVISGGENVARHAPVTAADSIEQGRWATRFLVDGYSSRENLELRELQQRHDELLAASADEPTRRLLRELSARAAEIEREITDARKNRIVYAAVPLSKPRPIHLLARGDVKQPKQLMEPGTLSFLAGERAAFVLPGAENEGARRAALAKWIVDPSNPLTRRSIVNRVWQYHFGRGIVETPNDFGKMGTPPTHPELLDWLATWFSEHGESIKALHRLIVTSATYRQSSAPNPHCSKVDADNRYLWRMNRARLDAECVHDALLAVSGTLDPAMGGPSVQQFYFKDDHSPVYDYARFDPGAPGADRRSIYRFIVRSVPDPFMETLDCPDASLLTPRRNTTLTALQALSLLNNRFVTRQAERLAARIAADSSDPRTQVSALYRLTLCREPDAPERKLMDDYLARHGLANACRVLLNSNEFLFVD